MSYLTPEGSEPSRKAIAEKLLDKDLSDTDRMEALLMLTRHPLPPDYVLQTVRQVTEKFSHEESTTEGCIKVLASLKIPEATALAARRLTDGPLTEYDLDSATGEFARRAVMDPLPMRALLKSLLTKQAKAKTEEPHSNSTVCACIPVADEDLLDFVEKQPARLFAKGLREEVLAGMRLKIKPPSSSEAELTAWCELLKKDEELGHATPFFTAEVKRVAGTALKERAVQELRRLLPKPGEEVTELINELSGKPPSPGPPEKK